MSGHESPSRVSVVICAYTLERWDDIIGAVASVAAQRRPVHEVVIVSDHNEELLGRLREHGPVAVVVANTGAPGLSGARNTGVAAATGDIVAFLDDDAAADPEWTERLVEAYAQDPNALGVSGHVRPEWRAPRPAWFPDEFLWVVGCSYRGQPESRAVVRNGIGANMSFRRDVLTTIGGFDSSIGRIGKDAAGCEETELSIRARRAFPGQHIVLEPGARCAHAVTPDRVTKAYFRRRCKAEGRSKALVAGLVSRGDALQSETAYVKKTLPLGVLRNLGAGLRGDRSGFSRAVMIVEGLTCTATTYLVARRRPARAAVPERGKP